MDYLANITFSIQSQCYNQSHSSHRLPRVVISPLKKKILVSPMKSSVMSAGVSCPSDFSVTEEEEEEEGRTLSAGEFYTILTKEIESEMKSKKSRSFRWIHKRKSSENPSVL